MADKKISALTASTTPLAGTEVLPIVQGGSTVKVAVSDLTAGRAVSALSLGLSQGMTGGSGYQAAGFSAYRASGGSMSSPGDASSYYNGITGYTLQARAGSSYDWALIDPGNNNYIAQVPTGTQNFRVASGNLVVGTAGKGIDFSANTHAAGMTKEVLDWYEEGTWTPTLVGGTTAGDYSVATTSAKYTRIGRQVTVTAGMVITVNSAGTGVAKFSGLPFAKGADQFLSGSVYTSSVSYGAGVLSVNVQAWTSGSSSDFALVGVKSGTAPYDVAITDFVNGSAVYVTMTYFV